MCARPHEQTGEETYRATQARIDEDGVTATSVRTTMTTKPGNNNSGAAEQQSSRAAEQQSRVAEQQSSIAAEQQSSRAAAG